MVEIHAEFEETDFNGIRQRKVSARTDEKVSEIETVKWDTNEDFTVYTTKFYELINAAGLDDASEQCKVELFLQSLPPKLKDIIQMQIDYQKKVFEQDFQLTLNQIIKVATIHISKKFSEIETIRWDQKEDFTVYTTKFYELINAAGLDDAPEQRKVELFLQSLPSSLINVIQIQINCQKRVFEDFQPTLKQVIKVATIHLNELGNKSLSKSFWSLNKAFLDNKETIFCCIFGSFLIIFLVYLVSYKFIGTSEDSIFQKFAKSTEDMVSKINSADLPGSTEIMKHTVECKSTANLIERDPAFKNSGSIIATNLRKFGESVMEAGNDLQIMYRKGSYVFETFKIEIRAMMDRLDVQDPNKGEFFKERIKKMISVVQDFGDKVKKAKDSIIDTENYRDGLEKELISGIREAEKYIEVPDYYWKRDSVDLKKAEVGLATVNNILHHLKSAHYRLDMIIKSLRSYENSLFDVKADLETLFIVTRHDFNYLLNSVEILQRNHRKFMEKENS